MRLRLRGLALAATIVAAVCGGCKFAGVSTVYMAIDSGGAQRRGLFYTDSVSVYCIAKFSSAKQDATVDFTVRQTHGPNQSPPLHPIFSVYETVPGPGTESVVAFQIPPNGIEVQIMCSGVCLQNGVGCPSGYNNEGPDSCGVGAECCFNLFAQAGSQPTVLPYPVGDYECDVSLDGELVGTTPFSIEYPPLVNGMICPVTPPMNSIVCADLVPKGAKCQGFNAAEICTCDGAAWDCKGK